VRFGPLALIALIGCAGAGDRQVPEKPLASTKPPVVIDPESGLTEPRPIAMPGVLLRLKFKLGQVYQYELSGTMTVSEVPGEAPPPKEALQTTKLRMRYSSKVSSISAGKATLRMHTAGLEAIKGKAGGRWVPAKHVGEIIVDERGLIYNDAEGLVSGVTGVGMIPFPKEKVGYASLWKRDSERSMAPFGLVKISESYTFRGALKENGVPLYRVNFKGSGSLPDFEMNGSYYYRQSDCSLYRAELFQSATIDVPDTPEKEGVGVARITLRVVVKPR